MPFESQIFGKICRILNLGSTWRTPRDCVNNPVLHHKHCALLRKISDQARSTMKGLYEHRFVVFEIQAIRDALHSEISPILLAMKLFPLQVKRIKIAPLLKIYFVCLNYMLKHQYG